MSQRSVQTPTVTASAFTYYEGHLASYPNVMVGKLILNTRYLVFMIHEPKYAGILETPRLTSSGRVLSIRLSSIVDVMVESGVRAKSSRPNWKNRADFEKKSSGEREINRHPGFLDDSESYSKLMLTIETERGVEIASFEVQHPQAWEQSIKEQMQKIPV